MPDIDRQEARQLFREYMETNEVATMDEMAQVIARRLGAGDAAQTATQLTPLLKAWHREYQETSGLDRDEIVAQSFPASDPPPPPGK